MELKRQYTLQPLTHVLNPSCFPSTVCLVQLRNKLNQDQNSKLQQQRDSLNKRNLEVAAMDKRVSELRDRLWKKKAALQHKENLPVRRCLTRTHVHTRTRANANTQTLVLQRC